MGVGLAAGILLGLLAAFFHWPALLWLATAVRPLGQVFLSLLSMVVIPLVVTSLFTGVAGLGDLRRVGRLGVRTMAFYWGTTLLAIAIGFAAAALLLPLGRLSPADQATLRDLIGGDAGAVRQAAQQLPSGVRFLIELFPANPVRAAVEGALLPLVVFVTLFAAAAAALPGEKRAALVDLSDAATQALIRIIHWVLWLAPVGIFALVLPIVAQYGWKIVQLILWFWVAVALGCLVFIAVVYVPAVTGLAHLRPPRFLHAAFPSMLMGFSTTSSLAALPTMLDSARSDLRVSTGVAGFTLPLGASANRGGSALYQAVALLFVAQLNGASLDGGALLPAAAAVFLASLTVAAVPSASVVSLMPAFTATGLPLAGLGVLIGLDRVPDMFRTMTNVTGDMAAASVIATIEGETIG